MSTFQVADAIRLKLVAYYRVSTKAQGQSGLGLAAQETAVERYCDNVNGEIVRSFEEIETGTRKKHRPVLQEALQFCKRTGATLVVAKLDRLARNARFLLGILESDVPLAFCDFPEIPKGPAGKLILTNMAAIAEWEGGIISERVTDSLAEFKAAKRIPLRIRTLYGENVPPEIAEAVAGKLGASLPQCRNLATAKGLAAARAAAESRRLDAIRANATIAPRITQGRAEGKSYAAIAAELNAAGEMTRGSATKAPGPWSATQVRRVAERVKVA